MREIHTDVSMHNSVFMGVRLLLYKIQFMHKSYEIFQLSFRRLTLEIEEERRGMEAWRKL